MTETVRPRSWRMSPLLRGSVGLHLGAAAIAAAEPTLWPWTIAAVATNHALLTASGLWPRSRWLGPNLLRLPPSAGACIAITIDDGPDPAVTPAVLDLLEQRGVHATFFCIGERVRAHGALAREMVRCGHQIENHSHRHAHHFSLSGPQSLQRELNDAQNAISDVTGRLPVLFRAPAGLRNPLLEPVLARLGLHLTSWTRRGFDTRVQDPDRVLTRLTAGLGAGDILLLHDGHCARTSAGRPVLLDVLPRLLDQAQSLGLTCMRVADALDGVPAVEGLQPSMRAG
ncbi:MAG: polysaccharide deacetylase family protein [Burkholderiaceae bacterium]